MNIVKHIMPLIVCIIALVPGKSLDAKQKVDNVFYASLEEYLGAHTYDYLSQNVGFYNDKKLIEQAAKIAGRLNDASKNRRVKDIAILNSKDINAYAIPGGHIILLSGIYQLFDSEDMLACVIGHETGHLEERHSLRNFILSYGIDVIIRSMYSRNQEEQKWLKAQYVGFLTTRGFSREEELEADTLAMEYVKKAGYNPQACIDFMYKLKAMERSGGVEFTLESTHPPADIRVEKMKEWLQKDSQIRNNSGSNGPVYTTKDGAPFTVASSKPTTSGTAPSSGPVYTASGGTTKGIPFTVDPVTGEVKYQVTPAPDDVSIGKGSDGRWNAIAEGLSTEEVQNALGPPNKINEYGKNRKVWSYGSENGYVVFNETGKVVDWYKTKPSVGERNTEAELSKSGNSMNIQITENTKEIYIKSNYYLGKRDAPVTMVEFSDMQCPYCKKYFENTYINIIRNYVDTGKVCYVHINLPLHTIHNQALQAANALYCAGEQSGYWPMHDILLENQKHIDLDDLKRYATDINMDVEQFTDCTVAELYKNNIIRDLHLAKEYEITGTPGFIIGKTQDNGYIAGSSFSGAIQDSVIIGLIEKHLQE